MDGALDGALSFMRADPARAYRLLSTHIPNHLGYCRGCGLQCWVPYPCIVRHIAELAAGPLIPEQRGPADDAATRLHPREPG